jgi:hypothetical protein
MEQTSHHRDTEAQKTEKKVAFLCASVVNAIDFFTPSPARGGEAFNIANNNTNKG